MEREEYQILGKYLERLGRKRTSKRDLVLEVFLGTQAHLSTEALCELVQARDPEVSGSTVYRTLKLFKESGLARELEFHDGRRLYEPAYNHTHHGHLICTQCGDLIEFYSEKIEALQDEVSRRCGFKQLHHSHRIFGLCGHCQSTDKDPANLPS